MNSTTIQITTKITKPPPMDMPINELELYWCKVFF
jgi:hypothetical protein